MRACKSGPWNWYWLLAENIQFLLFSSILLFTWNQAVPSSILKTSGEGTNGKGHTGHTGNFNLSCYNWHSWINVSLVWGSDNRGWSVSGPNRHPGRELSIAGFKNAISAKMKMPFRLLPSIHQSIHSTTQPPEDRLTGWLIDWSIDRPEIHHYTCVCYVCVSERVVCVLNQKVGVCLLALRDGNRHISTFDKWPLLFWLRWRIFFFYKRPRGQIEQKWSEWDRVAMCHQTCMFMALWNDSIKERTNEEKEREKAMLFLRAWPLVSLVGGQSTGRAAAAAAAAEADVAVNGFFMELFNKKQDESLIIFLSPFFRAHMTFFHDKEEENGVREGG